MSNGAKCGCPRCTVSGLMGPVVLITIGVIFMIGQMHWGVGIRQLWPVILIVIGLVKLAESMASASGHMGSGGSSEQR